MPASCSSERLVSTKHDPLRSRRSMTGSDGTTPHPRRMRVFKDAAGIDAACAERGASAPQGTPGGPRRQDAPCKDQAPGTAAGGRGPRWDSAPLPA